MEMTPTSAKLSRMKPRTLREDVVSILREAIINGSLPPESEINQVHIALELGISRGPLREALGQLEQDGFIRNLPFKGVFVTPLTEKYVEDLYALRSEMEVFAAVRLIHRVLPEHIDCLNALVAEMQDAAEEDDAKRLVDLDLGFHRFIVEQADNAPLLQAWKPLEMGVRRCLHARHRIYASIGEIIGTHPALVEAIGQRNAKEASQLLRAHILDAGDQLCKHWPKPCSPTEGSVSTVDGGNR